MALITKPEIKTPSDLIGKNVMLHKADLNSANYQQMFKMFGINEKNVNFVEPDFNTKNFENVDAISIFLTNEPFNFIKNSIQYNILYPNNYGVEFNDVNLFTSEKFAKENPKLVSDFTQASTKGWQYAIDNIEETVDVIFNKYNTQNKSKEALLYEAKESQKFIQSKYYELGKLYKEKIEPIAKLYIELGLAKNSKNIDDFIHFKDIDSDVNLENSTETLDLNKEEINFLKNNEYINISSESDYPPFDFKVGNEPYGFSIDLIKLLAKKIGFKINFVNGTNWNDLVVKFQNKEIDVLHSLSITEARKEIGDYSKPYIWFKTHFITRDNNPEIKDVTQLYGKIVATAKDWAVEEYLTAHHPKIKLLLLENIDDMFEAVANGEAYAFIGNDLAAKYIIKKNGYSNLKISSWYKDFDDNLKKSFNFLVQKDKPILLDLLNKALKSLNYEEMEALEKKWFGLNNLYKGLNFNNEEREYIKNKKVLNMCVDPNWMPLEAIDDNGKYIGVASDLINIMKNNSSLDFKLVKTVNWSESLAFMKLRKCDILPLAMYTEARKSYMDFTFPYLKYPFVIATRKNEIFVDKIETILDKKIALVKDYDYTNELKNRYPNKVFIEVESVNEGLTMLENKKIFAFVDSLPSIAYSIQSNNYLDVKISGRFDEQLELSMAYRNDEPVLNTVLQKLLNTLTYKEKEQAYNNWFTVRYEYKIDNTLIWKILIPIIIFVLYGLFWSRKVYAQKVKTLKALTELRVAKKELEKKNIELEKISTVDKLTNVYNRHKIDSVLKEELIKMDRYNTFFGLIIIDIDYFKLVNDEFGHNVGDAVLKQFSAIFLDNSRKQILSEDGVVKSLS